MVIFVIKILLSIKLKMGNELTNFKRKLSLYNVAATVKGHSHLRLQGFIKFIVSDAGRCSLI